MCVGTALSQHYNILNRMSLSNKHKGYTTNGRIIVSGPQEPQPAPFQPALAVRTGTDTRIVRPREQARVEDYNFLGRQAPSNKHKGYTRVERPPVRPRLPVRPPTTEEIFVPEPAPTNPPPQIIPALPVR